MSKITYISPDLQALAKPITFFKPDPRNARKHSAFNLESIRESLKDSGQVKPVVCLPDGTLVAGNGTWTAAKGMGWQFLAAVTVKDKKAAQRFALADNRTAELAAWDEPLLAELLAEIKKDKKSVTVVGFTDQDLEAMLKEVKGELPISKKKKPSRLVHTCPHCGKKFSKESD